MAQTKTSAMDRLAGWVSADWARVLLLGCLVFLFCFDVSKAFQLNPFLWRTDDGCLLQHLGAYLGIQGDDVCRGSYIDNYYAPGAAVFWIIPGLLGKAIAHLRGENVTQWILPLAAMASYACWIVALYFMTRILGDRRRQLGLAGWWLPVLAFAAMLNTFSFHYGTSRVFMAHAAEIMLALGCVHFLLRNELFHALPFAMMLVVTRYNDAPVALLFLGAILDRKGGWRSLPEKTRIPLAAGVVGMLLMGAWIALFRGYDRYTLFDLWDDFRWEFVTEFLVSWRWGMVWSGSWWLAALGIGVWRFGRMTYLGRASVVWLALEGILSIAWGGNGNDFAYRYLIGSFAAALVVWLELAQEHRLGRKVFIAWTAANGIWVGLMTVHYGTSQENVGAWNEATNACFIPPKLTLNLMKSVFDWKSYEIMLTRRVVPVSLYLSANPARVSPWMQFTPVGGPGAWVAAWSAIASALYVAIYGIASWRLRPARAVSRKKR